MGAERPGLGGLEAHEVDAVIAYVRSQQALGWGEEP